MNLAQATAKAREYLDWVMVVFGRSATGPLMPRSNNAHDYYVRAGSAISDAAAQALRQHAAMSMSLKRRYLLLYGGSLRVARAGLGHPYHPPRLVAHGAKIPVLRCARGLGWLLMLEASAHLGTRQFGKAMDTVLDAFHLAGDISRGAPLICHLVTINLQAIARQQAWAVIPHLSAPDAHRAVRRLERILTAAMPLEDVLREEASYAFASLEFLTQSPAHLRWSIEADVGKLDLTDAELLATYGPHVETCARALAEMANAFIGSLRRPYPARVAPDPPANPLLHGTCATWGETVFRSTVSTAQNRLLLAALALRAWHATHGKFPDSLQALCPSCLSAVPVDPFSDGEPLCYKSGGNAYLLYNRGPDGKDDGGARIQHGVGDAASADQVTPRSMGDMVAGIELNAVTPYMAAYLERIMANPPPSG